MKYLLYTILAGLLLSSCESDDDSNTIPVRDRQEVFDENIIDLETYLSTHFYNYEDFDPANPSDFEIVIDTLAGANADKIALIDRPELERLSITRDEVDYEYFVLKVREGEGALRPTYADSTLISYRGFNLQNEVFDEAQNPLWLDLPNTIAGFSLGLTEFKESTDRVQNPDGTFTFENSGMGVIFMPSGLAYFNNPPNNTIGQYNPIAFSIKLRTVEITDHDGDGILSIYEDLNNDRNLRSGDADDTDGDGISNFLDADDDGDGISTREEISDEDGNLLILNGDPSTAPDSDNDGIPDYLDNRTEASS
ncbi:FKBP-type peptidyl-prolyl cis-trans isomerase [Nonlabens spongiae]|nr:hypothetical protein [Nonlabens spongiae]